MIRSITLAIFLFAASVLAADEPFQLRDGDRVTLLGGGFIERMQSDGYLETILTSRLPNLNITYRNLGWSGDTVYGEARGVFGGQPEGFKRLINDVKLSDPTVILIAYGNNAAHDGLAGIPHFEKGLLTLLDSLAETKARLVLLSPIERENVGPPLPDPTEYNSLVRRYGLLIEGIADERKIPYLELNPLAKRDQDYRPIIPEQQLTEDSLTLTPYGSWLAAGRIAEVLGAKGIQAEIKLDVKKEQAFGQGVIVSNLAVQPNKVEFVARSSQLPYPELPEHAPPAADGLRSVSHLIASGLKEGDHRLLIDGREAARASSDRWAEGVPFVNPAARVQGEQLRTAINIKNELFFNRYRPQNETYLFLFRKHEQGNNAVEIPQFDPLIEIKEKEIAELRKPQSYRFMLEPVE